MATLDLQRIQSKPGEPIWELAKQYPYQGDWTLNEWLSLEMRGVEFNNGCLEFLPVPSLRHQALLQFFYRLLFDRFQSKGLGWVYVSGVRMPTVGPKGREPDVAFVKTEHAAWRREGSLICADLVAEVVSPSPADVERDYELKRTEYAQAGIAEYWIIDPQAERVTVLRLDNGVYVEHALGVRGDTLNSALLPDLRVDVGALLAAE